MSYEITGKIIDITPVNQLSEKFRKREFVLEVKEDSPSVFFNYVKFQLVQEKCELIKESMLNQNATVIFDLKGRKWVKDGKVSYFTNLEAGEIDIISSRSAQPVKEDEPPARFDEAPETDDLPF